VNPEATAILWMGGDLEYKLRPDQRATFDKLKRTWDRDYREFVLLLSRQQGKTHICAILALEIALRGSKNPDTGESIPAAVCWLTKTKKSAKATAMHVFRTFTRDAPAECAFYYDRNDDAWVCTKNQSRIYFVGAESETIELQRGRTWDLVIVDEAAHIKPVSAEQINGTVLPGTIKRKAMVVYATTRASIPHHPFDDVLAKCQANDAFVDLNIYDDPTHPDYIDDAIEKAGGIESTTFRREYLNERVFDDSSLVVPEWQILGRELTVVRPLPQYCDKYVGMDVGHRDLCVPLFGFLDFATQTLHIQAEKVLKGNWTPGDVAYAVTSTETALWGSSPGKVRRVADKDLTLLASLEVDYRLYFEPVAGGRNKPAMIAMFRDLIAGRRFTVDPSCTKTLETLYGATYKSPSGHDFDRTDKLGHADALDSAIYMAHLIDWNRNPRPISTVPGQDPMKYLGRQDFPAREAKHPASALVPQRPQRRPFGWTNRRRQA